MPRMPPSRDGLTDARGRTRWPWVLQHHVLVGVLALRLRDALTATLEAQVTGRRPDPDDLAILAAAVAEAHAAGALALDGSLRWRWSPAELASVRHTVADAAYELLGGPSAPRIGECDGPGCGWFFLDRTKRGNRRWCTMRDCGQQAKTAGRRARRGGAG